MGNLVAAKLPTASYCRTSVRLLGCKFARCGCSRRRMSSFHQRPPQLSASSWRKWSADCVRALKLCVQQSHNWGKTTEFQFVTSTRREKYRDWLLPGKRDDYLVQQLPFNRVRSLFFPSLAVTMATVLKIRGRRQLDHLNIHEDICREVVHSQIECTDFKSSKKSLNLLDFLGFFGIFRIFWIFSGFSVFFRIFLSEQPLSGFKSSKNPWIYLIISDFSDFFGFFRYFRNFWIFGIFSGFSDFFEFFPDFFEWTTPFNNDKNNYLEQR